MIHIFRITLEFLIKRFAAKQLNSWVGSLVNGKALFIYLCRRKICKSVEGNNSYANWLESLKLNVPLRINWMLNSLSLGLCSDKWIRLFAKRMTIVKQANIKIFLFISRRQWTRNPFVDSWIFMQLNRTSNNNNFSCMLNINNRSRSLKYYFNFS